MTSISIVTNPFEIDYKYALIITYSNYDGKFSPLPTTKNDGDKMREYLVNICKFPEKNVECHNDRPYSVIKRKYDTMFQQSKCLGEFERKGLYFIYFSGHGSFDGEYTYGHSHRNDNINLDKMVNDLSLSANTYVIGFFDCCRVKAERYEESKEGSPGSGQYYIIYATPANATAMIKKDGNLSHITESFLKFMTNPRNPKETESTPSHDFPIRFYDWAENPPQKHNCNQTIDLIKKTKPIYQDSIDYIFSLMDTNGNGIVSIHDVMQCLKYFSISGANGHIVRHHMSYWMRSFSSSNSNQLNREEFRNFYSEKLQRDLPEILKKVSQDRTEKDKTCSEFGEKVLFKIWENADEECRKGGKDYFISWNIFSEKFWETFDIDKPSTEYQNALKLFLGVKTNKVEFDNFNLFVNILGCLITESSNLLVNEMVSILKQSWFCGFEDRRVVEKKLVPRQVKPGLVRISTSQNFFCLSSFDFERKNNYDHMLLHPEYYGKCGIIQYVNYKAKDMFIKLL